MRKEQLKKFYEWFDKYVAGFYGDDDYVNANIRLKEDHSRRVCEEMLYITGELNLTANQNLTAEVIALFHDIGRFEQFTRYRTYSDHRSVDHSKLGLLVLRQEGILDGVEENERRIIEKAIEYHNIKELPAGLDGDVLLQSQLIRDADKLDIYYIVSEYYKQYEQNPDGFKLEIELPNGPGYSKDVLQSVLDGRRIDYKQLRSWNDMKLCELSWVYDVNFAVTLKKIQKAGFLEMIVGFLPRTDEIAAAAEAVRKYVEKRIAENDR